MIQRPGDRAKYRFWNRLRIVCLLGGLLSLTACAMPDTMKNGNIGSPQSQAGNLSGSSASNSRRSAAADIGNELNVSAPVAPSDRSMLSNLADAVAQVFDPVGTTLQINKDNDDPRMQYLVTVLAEKGFGIQRVSADQGANYLGYTRNEQGKDEIRMSVAVGAVIIGRDYKISEGDGVEPVSTMRLSGTRVPIVVDAGQPAHIKVSNPALSQAEYVASLSLDDQAPVISLITPQIVDQVSRISADDRTSLQALNSSKVEVNNLFYADASTFASMLDNRTRIYRQVVIFGNDSMVLGDTNKQLIEQFVSERMQRSDIVSLVGCSNGPTALKIGNEGLALGRARRVTEELMSFGVARDRILDEGCWAPTNAGDRFPSRGVVIELWRGKR